MMCVANKSSQIEKKGKGALMMNSYLKLALSNDNFFLGMEQSDRRMVILSRYESGSDLQKARRKEDGGKRS